MTGRPPLSRSLRADEREFESSAEPHASARGVLRHTTPAAVFAGTAVLRVPRSTNRGSPSPSTGGSPLTERREVLAGDLREDAAFRCKSGIARVPSAAPDCTEHRHAESPGAVDQHRACRETIRDDGASYPWLWSWVHRMRRRTLERLRDTLGNRDNRRRQAWSRLSQPRRESCHESAVAVASSKNHSRRRVCLGKPVHDVLIDGRAAGLHQVAGKAQAGDAVGASWWSTGQYSKRTEPRSCATPTGTRTNPDHRRRECNFRGPKYLSRQEVMVLSSGGHCLRGVD